MLLTAEDTIRRGHYRNAQRALTRLLDLGVVPVVNENDTVATDEIRFGDNDRLAALVSHLVHADAMVLLTDVDALYDGPPSRPGARRITEVHGPADLEGIEVTGRGSAVGTGGMLTKLDSVAIATGSGIPVVLTSAAARPTRSPAARSAPGSRRPGAAARRACCGSRTPHARTAASCSTTARCRPCAAASPPCCPPAWCGSRASSRRATRSTSSGSTAARSRAGWSSYDAAELPGLLGRSTSDLRAELGPGYDREIVHRDDLVLVRRTRR